MVVLVLLAGCPGRPSGDVPSEWDPGVVLGEGVFQRAVWSEVPVGRVSEIRVRSNPTPAMPILVVGAEGAAFMTQDGSVTQTIRFDRRGGRVVAVDLDRDGQEEFLDRGGGWQPVSIYDSRGVTIWSYGKRNILEALLRDAPNDMAMGDVDGDGRPEFVVGFNGSGGVHLLDGGGRVLWKQADGNVWGVEIRDLDGDGKGEIIHSSYAGRLTIRNHEGETLRSIRPGVYIDQITLCAWPHEDSPMRFLWSRDKKFYLVNASGKIDKAFDAPWGVGHNARCAPVRFEKGRELYFAVVALVRASWKRSLLYIYDPTGRLIYQEVIPTRMATLTAMPSTTGKGASLFVGGEGVVWEYSLSQTDLRAK
ncbi:MAG: FG-GAP repeat domain-containing protein [Candidatus Methylomirabilales bacterium]